MFSECGISKISLTGPSEEKCKSLLTRTFRTSGQKALLAGPNLFVALGTLPKGGQYNTYFMTVSQFITVMCTHITHDT